jgi:hypothetical protein
MSITFGLRTRSSVVPQVDPFNGDSVLILQALTSKRSIIQFSPALANVMGLYTPDAIGNFHNTEVSMAQDDEGNFFIFVNDGSTALADAEKVKVSKQFTFSDKITYQSVVAKFNLDPTITNHIQVVPTSLEDLPGVTLFEMVGIYANEVSQVDTEANQTEESMEVLASETISE